MIVSVHRSNCMPDASSSKHAPLLTADSFDYERMGMSYEQSERLHRIFVTVCVVAGIAAVTLLPMSFKIVDPASVAVVVTMGSLAQESLGPGLHFVNPFATVTPFTLKTQLLEQANHVPTKEGLTVELDVACLFHITPDKVRDVYLTLGDKYQSTIVEPELASAVRGLTSEAEASALYTSGRAEMQAKLLAELKNALGPRGIAVENVLLKAVVLPSLLKDSIEKKVSAEQDSERMQFIIEKERAEATRKSIEAQGIADFQRIVSANVTSALLTWKGIEATREISQSANTKVVFVGNSPNSLPVIMGGAEGSNTVG